MDIDDLKADWQNAGGEIVNDEKLKLMTRISQHPTLKKLRIKLILETVFLTVLLFVYYDGFDGDKKPLYANALLVSSVLLYIANNVLGFLFIKNPIRAENISLSIQKHVITLKRLSIFSLLSSVVYAVTLIFYFSVSIKFTSFKYVLLSLLIFSFTAIFYFSYIKWKDKIDHFSRVLSMYIKDIA